MRSQMALTKRRIQCSFAENLMCVGIHLRRIIMRHNGKLREGRGSARSTFVATDTLNATFQRTRMWMQERRGEDKTTYPCANTASTMG